MSRRFIQGQIRLSRLFDQRLPERYRLDGKRDFLNDFVPGHLVKELTVWDMGGGSNPSISVEVKERLNLTIIGLDISVDELRQAPDDAYDMMVCADLMEYRATPSADVVICQAVLEHVEDTEAALRSIASVLKVEGVALIFAPNRMALFSRLNRFLPEELKRKILFAVFPGKRRGSGFPAYYDRCTPRDIRELAEQCRLRTIEERFYFKSSYFSFFFPLHVAWRILLTVSKWLRGNDAAETFAMAFAKESSQLAD